MHVQSVQNYCFSLSNMHICDVIVAIVIMLNVLRTQLFKEAVYSYPKLNFLKKELAQIPTLTLRKVVYALTRGT